MLYIIYSWQFCPCTDLYKYLGGCLVSVLIDINLMFSSGTTAEDLLSGVERLTKGEIRGRFFQLWPPRNVQLLTWLSQWMKQGKGCCGWKLAWRQRLALCRSCSEHSVAKDCVT